MTYTSVVSTPPPTPADPGRRPLFYLCQRYSNHPAGPDGAYVAALARARAFYEAGVHAVSPIVMTHAADTTSHSGRREPLPSEFYRGMDVAILGRCDAVVAWEGETRRDESLGVHNELAAAGAAGKTTVVVPRSHSRPVDAVKYVLAKAGVPFTPADPVPGERPLFYLCQMYSRHPAGTEGAYVDALARLRAFYVKGLHTVSPIVMAHPVDKLTRSGRPGTLPPEFYYGMDVAILARCDVVVAWEGETKETESFGVHGELAAAEDAGKSVVVVPASRSRPHDAVAYVREATGA